MKFVIADPPRIHLKICQIMFFDLVSDVLERKCLFSLLCHIPKLKKGEKSDFFSEDLPKSFEIIFSSDLFPFYLLTTSGTVCIVCTTVSLFFQSFAKKKRKNRIIKVCRLHINYPNFISWNIYHRIQ